MGRTEGKPDQVGQRLHQHYVEWFTGNGVTQEFRLQRRIDRIENVMVFVAGALKRPSEAGVIHDYIIRGLSAGYPGDQNAIFFGGAPGAGADIAVFIVST